MRRCLKPAVTLLILMLIAALVAGCGKAAQKDMVAEVNGQVITRVELDDRIMSIAKGLGVDTTTEEYKQQAKSVEAGVLEDLISEVLLVQAAKDKGIAITDQQVDEQFQEVKKSIPEENFQTVLESQNLTEDKLKQRIRDSLIYEALFNDITQGVTVSEAEVRQYYDEHKTDLAQVKVRHILISAPEDEATAEQQAAAKSKAEDVIKQLKSGADFATLAKQLSEDTGSKDSGGLYDYFFNSQTSNFVPEFTQASLAMPKGDYTQEPVKTTYGYHVIMVDDRQDSFDVLKQSVNDNLLKEAQNKVFGEYYDNLVKSAKIVNKLAEESKSADTLVEQPAVDQGAGTTK